MHTNLQQCFIILLISGFISVLHGQDDDVFDPDLEGDKDASDLRITEHPKSQFVVQGAQAFLKCEASGTPKPQIEWYKDDELVKDLTGIRINRNSLLFTFDKSHAGVYRCNASNSKTSALSERAELKLAFLDDFLEIDSSQRLQNLSINESMELPCEVPYGSPEPNIYWLHNEKRIVVSSSFTIESNYNLRIFHAQKAFSGQYVCVAENLAGVKRSGAYTLRVEQKAHFKTIPKNVTSKLGESAVFHCELEGDPKPTTSWRRLDNAPITAKRSSLTGDSLSIKEVQPSDAGTYVCYATNMASAEQLQEQAELRVISSPTFTKTPDDLTVEVGSDARFDCVTNEKEVRWIFREDVVFTHNRFQVYPNGTLFIRDVSKSNEGDYICRVSQASGQSIKSSAHLIVHDGNYLPLPVIQLPPYSQIVRLGTSATMPCFPDQLLNGNKKVHVAWYKNDQTIGPSGKLLIDDSRGLTIKSVDFGDMGTYKCKVSFQYGQIKRLDTEYVASLEVVNSALSPIDSLLPIDVPNGFDVQMVDDTWVLLKWQPVPGAEYLIESAEYNSRFGWSTVKTGITQTSVRIGNLKPDTGYHFMLRAVVGQRLGPPALLTRVVFTQPRMQQPLMDDSFTLQRKLSQLEFSDLYVSSITPKEVEIDWTVCAPNQVLSMISQFKLIARRVPLEACKKDLFSQGRFHCPHEEAASTKARQQIDHCSLRGASDWQQQHGETGIATIKEYHLSASQLQNANGRLQKRIDDLDPFTCYQFMVQAVFKSQQPMSKSSGTRNFLTAETVPSEGPRDLQAEWIEQGNKLLVTWQPPDQRGLNGLLQGYLFRLASNQFTENSPQNINVELTQMALSEFPRQANLTLYLAGYNCNGEGTRANFSLLNYPLWLRHKAELGRNSKGSFSLASLWPLIAATALLFCGGVLFCLLCWHYRVKRRPLSDDKLPKVPLSMSSMHECDSHTEFMPKKSLHSSRKISANGGGLGAGKGLLFRHAPDAQFNQLTSNLMMEQAIQQAVMPSQMMYISSDQASYIDPGSLSTQHATKYFVPPGMMAAPGPGANNMMFLPVAGAVMPQHNSPLGTTNSSSGFGGTAGSSSTSGGGVHMPSKGSVGMFPMRSSNEHYVDATNPYATTSLLNDCPDDNCSDDFLRSRACNDLLNRVIPPPPEYPPPPTPNSDSVDEYEQETEVRNESPMALGYNRRPQEVLVTPSSTRHNNNTTLKSNGSSSDRSKKAMGTALINLDGGRGITPPKEHYTYYCDLGEGKDSGNSSHNNNNNIESKKQFVRTGMVGNPENVFEPIHPPNGPFSSKFSG